MSISNSLKDSEACGGSHTFQSGVTVSYFSIYCIPRGTQVNNSTTEEEKEEQEEDVEVEHRIDTMREIVKVGNIYTEEQGLYSVLM